MEHFKSIKAKLTHGGKCVLPKVFWNAVIGDVGISCVEDGILLQPADENSIITASYRSKNDMRITLPRDILRVYDNPNLFDISFVDGRPDMLILKPAHLQCVNCQSQSDLRELERYECYVCRECLEKAFGITLKKKKR